MLNKSVAKYSYELDENGTRLDVFEITNTDTVKKEIDKLGRIVIPKECRERFNLVDKVEIVLTEEGILIRNKEYVLVKTNPENKNNPIED